VLAALYLNYKPAPEPAPPSLESDLTELQKHFPQMPEHLKLTPQWPTTRLLNMR
jgi:hypothetical protein